MYYIYLMYMIYIFYIYVVYVFETYIHIYKCLHNTYADTQTPINCSVYILL